MRKIISIGSALFLLLSVSGCAAPDSDSADPQQNAAETEAESQRATESPSEDADAIKQEVATMRISVKSEEYEIIYELNDSKAARELYAQLPLTTEVEPFSNNEMTFYPEKNWMSRMRRFRMGNQVHFPTMHRGEMSLCFMRPALPTAACMNWARQLSVRNISKI